MKRPKFNVLWNEDDNLGMGRGYYMIFENQDGEPTFSKYYAIGHSKEWNNEEVVSPSILDDVKNNIYNDWEFDIFYCNHKTLEEMFYRK